VSVCVLWATLPEINVHSFNTVQVKIREVSPEGIRVTMVDAYLKERLVICNDEDTDGRARVTTDEERVLPEDLTEIRLCTM